MKKLLLTLVLAFFAMIQGFSQPIFESFEGTFPPTGWTVTGSWQQYSYRASDGGMCAYMAYSGTSGRMILPAYTADVTTTLSFYVGASYASDAWMNDFTIEVTTSLEEPAWQEVYTIAYPTNITDFILQEVNLGAFAGQEIYVSFNLTPNNGAGTLLDAVTLGNITCPKPTGLAVVPASTSADFTWDEDETSLAYNLEVVQSNQDWENAEVSQVTGTEFTLTDLMPATMYKARLQSVCEDEELSQYSNVITFTTACSPIEDVIWFEDFESVLGNQEAANLMFSCWSVLQSTGGAYNGTFPRIYHEGYAGSAHSGQVTLEFKGNGFLLLPEFAQDITTQQLSFYANTTSATVEGAGTFQVGYVTDPTDTASFVALETVILPQAGLSRASSVMVGPFSYADIEVETARMALKYVAVNAGESWNLDDFTVEPIPDCPAPQSSSITVTGVTDSEATITWVDEDESHSAWLFYYKSSTEEDYTEIATTEQSITLTDLTQATAYSFYIQTDCGTDDNYSQTSVITFRTTAVPVTEFPYYQDFQDLEGNPFGAEFFTTGLNQWMIGSSTGVVDSENEELSSLYISNNNSDYAYTTQQNNSRSWVVMPIVFGDAPEYAISFQYKSGGEVSSWSSSVYDYLTVILCDADADLTNLSSVPSGTVVLDKAGGVTEWATATYASSALANTTKQLVFYWYNDGSDGSGIPGAIDNIAIIENTCAAPTNLTYTDVTGESAVLSWDTEGTSSWMLYYKAASDEEYTEVEVTEVPYTLTDLTPMTNYTAYVVADCDGELSVASTAVSFRTACSTVETFPYFEGFNDVYNLQDACWSAEVLSGYSNWTTSIDGAHGNSPYEGGRCAYITYFSGEARLSSPIFDLTEMNNPYLKYVVANPAYEGNAEQIIVEYKATPESDWVTLRSYTTANETWLLDSVALPSPTENYQIAFKAIGGQGWGASIDAVQVYDSEGEPGGEEPQPCDAPTNLSANNITETSAEITWNGTASTYEFKLNGGEAETLTTTTKTLTGLTANTAYTVEVRSICEDQTSDWVTTNFTTLEEIVTPEPCDTPTNLSASNITETSADITWTGTASTYEFKLNGGTAETLTTTTKALTGLTPNTAYTVEVRAVCEDAESDWVTTTFTTLQEIPEIIAPVVTTTEATSVTHESAVLNGTITAGSEEITAQGFRYKTA
ncbi:MAG: fibronectin type III domain-containing protein, partial [Bacteroidales bacterium]|nr:fibronectin type III domain-containing protein [Bacteroidales bacterium]